MTALVATHPHRPAWSSRHRVAPLRRGRTPSHALRHRGPPAVEPLESRMHLAADPAGFDAGFGVGGKVRLDLDGLADNALWVQTLPDGKVLVSGTSTYAVTVAPPPGADSSAQPVLQNQTRRFLARLKPDGSLDASFANGGILRFPNAGTDADPLALQPDGKILIGSTISIGGDWAFAVGRYNADGTVDTGFGDQGVATVNLFPDTLHPLDERITALAIQPDGKVAAAGVVEKPVGEQTGRRATTLGVVRLNANGTVDDSFARHVEDVNVLAKAVVVEPGGRIVVGGSAGRYTGASDPTPSDAGGFTLFRYNADGSVDGSFGQGGCARVPVRTAADSLDQVKLTDLLLQPDGKYAVVGSIGTDDFGLAQFNADGTADASFDADGLVLGHGIQATFQGEAVGQYRLRYDPSDGTVYVAGVGTGIEGVPNPDPSAPVTRRAKGLQVFSAAFAPSGAVVSAGRAVDLPMTGVESIGAVAVQDGGRIVGVGKAFPTADAGEGNAYAQTADVLVVRFDPAALPAVSNLLAYTYPPVPASGGTSNYSNGSGSSGGLIGLPDSSPATFSLNVTFAGRTSLRGGRAYPFRITYPNETLARQTPVTVTGPNAFNVAALALKVRAMGRARRAAGAVATPPPARPTVATYRLPAPGGGFGATTAGSYAVRINAMVGEAASGQIVGMFTVNGRAARATQVPDRLAPSWPLENGKVALTGVLRSTASIVGNTTGWAIDRIDVAGAGQLMDLDPGVFAGEAAALAGHRVKVVGTVQQQIRPGRRLVSVFVVESIARAM